MRSVTVNLTTFEPKQCKQQVCKAKVQKGVDWAVELKCEKQGIGIDKETQGTDSETLIGRNNNW